MLAQGGDFRTGPGWAHEAKFDGVRAVAYVSRAGGLRLLSRNDKDMTGSYPEIGVLPLLLQGHAVVLDGELVTLDARGAPSFGALQRRMHVVKPSAVLIASAPVQYMVFDLLYLDGSVVGLPWSDRRAALEKLPLNRPPIAVSPVFYGDPQLVMEAVTQQGLEGVVSKRIDAPHQPGKRTTAWTKIPVFETQEAVIIGWREGEGRRSGTLGSLLLAAHGPTGALDFIGGVGTGFTDRMLDEMLERLRPLEIAASPATGRPVPREYLRRAHWCKPVLVGEVQFRNWTDEGTLRHPSWRGQRLDKDAGQVTRPPHS
ncbi:MAG TPA: hypothetical protein DGG94_14225 [Micromonosporaceae bacterium]|nr:hypothetical protein [Micromonosporaceae bacterium]HCU50932.1 hypothetical protein [Micromonosporaceae bacterium]